MPIQAEEALFAGAQIANNHAGAEGAGFVDYLDATGAYIEWTEETSGAGAHGIDIRYALGATGSRTMALEVNGVRVLDDVTFSPTGGWSNWEVLRSVVDLQAGTNTLRLVATGDSGPNVDALAAVPLGPLDGPLTLEAETAALDGAVVDSIHDGALGDAFVDFTATAGQSVTWQVEALRDGETTLDIRYALAPAAARPMALEVNGSVVAELEFTSTGSWDIWDTAGTEASLTQGVNTIRLVATGNSGPNVDALFVGGSSAPVFGTISDGTDMLEPGEADVALDAVFSVGIEISETGDGIDAASVTSATVQLINVATNTVVEASVNTTGGGDAITLTPTTPLDPLTAYTLRIDGVLAQSGEAYPSVTRDFTTQSAEQSGDDPTPEITFTASDVAEAPALASLALSPDETQLYGATLGGSILRWDIAEDGTLSVAQEFVVDAGSSLIGLAFDPGDPQRLWFSQNTSLFGGDNSNYSGKIAFLDIDEGVALSGTVTDFAVGLPRSIRDHLTNSVEFGPDGALYVTQGSNTAMGAPDSAWGLRPETELSAAVLRLDVSQTPPDGGFDVATGAGGDYDPDAPGAPVTVYASGLRNSYDLLWHSNGSLYIANNGSAAGGNSPDDPTTAADETILRGATQQDYLYRVEEGGYYGHPNPTREEYIRDGGNPTAGEDPAEVSDYAVGTLPDPAYGGFAYDFGRNRSPNGSDEYRSDAVDSDLQGAMLVAEYSGGDRILALRLDDSGAVTGSTVVADGFNNPLDVAVQSSTGRIYVNEFGNGSNNRIVLLEPEGGTPVEPPAPVGEGGYSLEGPDAALFVIDAETGAITPQDWFVADPSDPWDQGDDNIYDVTRVFTPDDGAPAQRTDLQFETVAEGVLVPRGAPEPEPEPEPAPDPAPLPDPGPLPQPGEAVYSLEGPDEFLFLIDVDTGAIAPKDWFVPTLEDPWDQDEDNRYELVRVATDLATAEESREALTYEAQSDGSLVLLNAAPAAATDTTTGLPLIDTEAEPDTGEDAEDADTDLALM